MDNNKIVGLRAELYKYKKQKIYVTIIGLLIIPVLYALASVFQTNPFTQNDQSFCYWLGNVILMNSMMYATPIIFAYVSCLGLANEVETHYLGMVVQRSGSRNSIYISKVVSNIIVLTEIFILQIAGCALIYFLAYMLGANDVTGTLWGKGYNVEGVVMLMEFYAFYCLLLPIIINGLSLIIKNKSKVIIVFVVIVFMTRMLPNNLLTSHIMPWNILKQMSFIDATSGGNDLKMSALSLLNTIAVCCCMGSVFYNTGKNQLKKLNL